MRILSYDCVLGGYSGIIFSMNQFTADVLDFLLVTFAGKGRLKEKES